MKPSQLKTPQLTAVIRVFPRSHGRFALYYIDISDELVFIEDSDASSVEDTARRFAENNGFNAFEIQIGALHAKWSVETD